MSCPPQHWRVGLRVQNKSVAGGWHLGIRRIVVALVEEGSNVVTHNTLALAIRIGPGSTGEVG